MYFGRPPYALFLAGVVASLVAIACDNSRLVLELDDALPTSPSGAFRVPVGAVVTAALYDLHTGFVTEGFPCRSAASIVSSDPSVLWVEPGWRAGPTVPNGNEMPKRVALRAMRPGAVTLRGTCNGETDALHIEITSDVLVSTAP